MIIETNEKNIAELINKEGIVVLDFYANWCQPCKLLLPIIEEISNDLKEGVTFYKVNVDTNSELPISLGVVSIPTILFYKNGVLIKKMVGLNKKQEIESVIYGLLA
jgi:thioredoxin 1